MTLLLCVLIAVGPTMDHYDPSFEDSTHKPIHVVFLTPPGETTTPAEISEGVGSVTSALRWWQELLPPPLTITSTISDVAVLPTTTEVYTNPVSTYLSLAGTNLDTLYVFVVDNSSSQRQFYEGQTVGLAYAHMATWVVLNPRDAAAIQAHEFGHLYFMLPDWYLSPPCMETDIMCLTDIAYPNKSIGCQSLEWLGHPCKKVFIPLALG